MHRRGTDARWGIARWQWRWRPRSARRLLGTVGVIAVASVMPATSRVVVAPARVGMLHAEGLYPVEKDASGLPFVWTRLRPYIRRLIHRPVTLTLDLRSATAASGPSAPVTVTANGVPLGTVRPEMRNVRRPGPSAC